MSAGRDASRDVYSRITYGLPLIVLPPERGGSRVAIVTLRWTTFGENAGTLDRRPAALTNDFLGFLTGCGLGATFAVIVSHALGAGALVLRT